MRMIVKINAKSLLENIRQTEKKRKRKPVITSENFS